MKSNRRKKKIIVDSVEAKKRGKNGFEGEKDFYTEGKEERESREEENEDLKEVKFVKSLNIWNAETKDVYD